MTEITVIGIIVTLILMGISDDLNAACRNMDKRKN